ncbi:DUF4781 domain-containing protein [Paracoccus sulfuroxidans]|uniref:DNA/RNA non-specific endonuclease n=1 Tax=Paracoccus sulfuroxidans TaxID=384678 RepID=A0A562NSS8_9RHOB|nr:DUF4781 domain-containing protein [Paracoccus sulfuroxidans]TWI35121.1 DNA/RNA non-specific endonuclease [Paracoccus sulfuroxidans]
MTTVFRRDDRSTPVPQQPPAKPVPAAKPQPTEATTPPKPGDPNFVGPVAAAPATAPATGPAPTTAPTAGPKPGDPNFVGPVATAPGAPKPPAEEVTPERKAEISTWVADNAGERSRGGFLWLGHDEHGGERTAAAMRGDSSLGKLTEAEQRELARQSVGAVLGQRGDQRSENLREMAEGVKDDPTARRILAEELARPEAATKASHARGIPTMASEGYFEGQYEAMEQAIKLDPAAAVRQFDGIEPQLASVLGANPEARRELWAALGDKGRIPAEQADRLATSLFMFEDGSALTSQKDRQNFANAIANVKRPGDGPTDKIGREQTARNLEQVLQDPGARDMLFNQETSPEQRVWALDMAAADGACTTKDHMKGGWENEQVSRDYAQKVTDAYQQRGTDPQTLSGEALRNTVGQAMGYQPDQLPEGAQTDAMMAQGMDYQFYSRGGNNAALDKVADQITSLGGADAKVTVIPISVTAEGQGAAVVPLFRVETEGGPQFVDHSGRTYKDVKDWEENNTLPEGKMTYAEGLDLKSDKLTHRNTPGVVDTFSEGFGKVVDGVAIGAGIVAGVVIIAGSGGTAAPLVAGGAGLWMAGRAGQSLHDKATHGQDITDLSDPSVRADWLEVAAGTLSVGALGGAMKLATAGARVTPGLARTVAGLGYAAEGADAIAMADQAIQLGQNWDNMSGKDRAASLLNIGFWAGMSGASHRAGQSATNGTGFAGIDASIRNGTATLPRADVPVSQNTSLAPGEVRVAYDTQNGRATNVRIETGTGPISPDLLALHQTTANQMKNANGLRDRLTSLLTGQQQPEVGSNAWEAKLEIDKITTESSQLATQLANAKTPTERDAIAVRQRELDQALVRETRRLDAAASQGNGFVAAPRSQTDIQNQYVASGDITLGIPAGTAALAAPKPGDAKLTNFGTLKGDQAQGIEVTLDRSMLDTGTHADPNLRPPGFEGGGANHSRGHLLARRLGGDGAEMANLVTLYQNPTNSPVMRSFEDVVYRAVDAGENVNYRVTPVYAEGNPVPTHIVLQAKGDQGLDIAVTINNRDGV